MKGFFGALEGLLVRAPDGKGDYETAMENYYIAASIGANADLKDFFYRCGPSSPKIPKKLSLHSGKLKGAAQQFLKVFAGRQRSGVCLKMDMGDTTNNPNMVNSIGKVMTNWKRMTGV